MKTILSQSVFGGLVIVALGLGSISSTNTCTRTLYTGEDGVVITGRTMDFYKVESLGFNQDVYILTSI